MDFKKVYESMDIYGIWLRLTIWDSPEWQMLINQ